MKLSRILSSRGTPPAATLTVSCAGKKPCVYPLTKGCIRIGRSPENDIVIDDGSVSVHHAEIRQAGGKYRLLDTGSSNGTFLKGVKVSDEELKAGMELEFGGVPAIFALEPRTLRARWNGKLRIWRRRFRPSRSLLVSSLLHGLLLLLAGQAILFSRPKGVADFTSAATGFLAEEAAKQGEESAAVSGVAEYKPAPPAMATGLDVKALVSMITTTSVPAGFNVSAPAFSANASLPPTGLSAGLSGAGRGLGKGFGQGSGLGKGIVEWLGSGSGGIGVSGRGKTLKTVNEFSCYFVIHSGDWYAALDWRTPAASRQTEISYPDLPDAAKLQWYKTAPVAGMGPFLAYYYGFAPRPNHPEEIDDDRTGCVEFTPGAMSNLLRFLRVASNNNIKGASKPKGVVLDRALVPYRYDKVTSQVVWNAEGREKLRETLREALPRGGRFGNVHGYLWNPQPAQKDHSDFVVEYLLDVKPMPPFVYFTGNDDFVLSEPEIETLNEYLRQGGAIWGDCGFAGNRSKFDIAFRREIKRVIPDDDKPFRVLPRNNTLFVRGDDAYFDLPELPPGMQFYQAPVETIEITPGVVSVVLTKNAYGNFLRYEMTMVNNQFQMGGELGRGRWVNRMWEFREEFFRGLSDENVLGAYSVGSNILVYMLGRWPAVLNRLENR